MYQSGDFVWIKVGRYPWWPAIVIDEEDSKNTYSGKKVPLAHVKFLNEDCYEMIFEEKKIFPFQSPERDQFVNAGWNLKAEELRSCFETALGMVDGFDVSTVVVTKPTETESSVTPSDVNAEPKVKPKRKSTATPTDGKKSVKRKIAPCVNSPAYLFSCDICDFGCGRINILIEHQRGHIKSPKHKNWKESKAGPVDIGRRIEKEQAVKRKLFRKNKIPDMECKEHKKQKLDNDIKRAGKQNLDKNNTKRAGKLNLVKNDTKRVGKQKVDKNDTKHAGKETAINPNGKQMQINNKKSMNGLRKSSRRKVSNDNQKGAVSLEDNLSTQNEKTMPSDGVSDAAEAGSRQTCRLPDLFDFPDEAVQSNSHEILKESPSSDNKKTEAASGNDCLLPLDDTSNKDAVVRNYIEKHFQSHSAQTVMTSTHLSDTPSDRNVLLKHADIFKQTDSEPPVNFVDASTSSLSHDGASTDHGFNNMSHDSRSSHSGFIDGAVEEFDPATYYINKVVNQASTSSGTKEVAESGVTYHRTTSFHESGSRTSCDRNLEADACDSDPDLPLGLSPMKLDCPKIKDIMWVKIGKYPHWPAIVVKVYTKKKKVAKLSVKFIGDIPTAKDSMHGYKSVYMF